MNFCTATQTSFSNADLLQLHQWQLWLNERGATWPRLPPPLAERCRVAFCATEGNPSQLQRDVTTALAALGLKPREEVRTAQGYSIDAVVHVNGRDVAVEVDGPYHFVGHSPTGATVLKRRQLHVAGWPLLSVPYWEWGALDNDAAGRREYLLRGLAEAGAQAKGGAVAGAGGTAEGDNNDWECVTRRRGHRP